MSDKELGFPTYRKYKGINVWFMILNANAFVEIKQIGEKFVQQEIQALQYPEMVLIQDMLACYEDRWEIISETEFRKAELNV